MASAEGDPSGGRDPGARPAQLTADGATTDGAAGRAWIRIGSRLGAFSLLPFVSVLTPFLVLPAVARVGDLAGWAALGIGQAVGLTLSIIAMWGWYAAGPSRYAALTGARARDRLYLESVLQRLVALAVFGVPAVVLAGVLSPPGHAVFCIAVTIGIGASELSPAWYYIAQGSALRVALSDTLPKALLTVASVPVMLLTGTTWPYVVALALSAFAPPLVVAGALTLHGARATTALPVLLRDLWAERAVATTNVLNAAFTSTVVPIASITHGAGVYALVSADRVYRTGSSMTVALGNGLQSWVLEQRTRRRVARSVVVHAVLGFLGALLFAVLGPVVTGVLFGRELRADPGSCLAYGIAFLAVAVSMPLIRNLLIPAGRAGRTVVANVLAVAAGVPLMYVGSVLLGPTASAWGMAIGEVVIVLVLARPALVEYRALEA